MFEDIKFYYPFFKEKAATFSYDDGPFDCDKKLIEILDKYSLKATFNLVAKDCFYKNRVHMQWHHIGQPVDFDYNYLTANEVCDTYKNHEVACHGYDHLGLKSIENDELIVKKEVDDAKKVIEKVTQKVIKGYAYPNGEFSDRTKEILVNNGYVYARNIISTYKFDLPKDFMFWCPTCHDYNEKTDDTVNEFINTKQELALLYIWGHGYEMTRPDRNAFEHFEEICKKCSIEKVWGATNIEIYRYITAIRNLTYQDNKIYNNSSQDIYAEYKGKKIILHSGENSL